MGNHIIHKQKVTLQVSSQENAFDMQNRISRLLKDDLPPVMESVLNKISPNGKILRIDQLNLDLGAISMLNLESEFRSKLIEKLEEALYSAMAEKGELRVEEISGEQSLSDSLMYFLLHGIMPWYSTVKDFSAWESQIIQSFSENEWRSLSGKIRSEGSRTHPLLLRLAQQFSIPFLQKFILRGQTILDKDADLLFDDLKFLWAEFSKGPVDTGYRKEVGFWQEALNASVISDHINEMIFSFIKSILLKQRLIRISRDGLIIAGNDHLARIKLLGKNIKTDEVHEALEMLTHSLDETGMQKKEPALKDGPEEEKPVTIPKPPDDGDELFAENCGIVLLHPFLQMYFAELGLLENEQFRDDDARQRGVLLLHYLATGQTNIAEIHLLIPKLLCAMNFEEPVPGEIDLTGKEKEESETLLHSVIRHWGALGNTSPDGLRQTFLQRDGKLVRTDTGWKLNVEQKTVDILMGKLPWGISAIRLPWMNTVLNIEWV